MQIQTACALAYRRVNQRVWWTESLWLLVLKILVVVYVYTLPPGLHRTVCIDQSENRSVGGIQFILSHWGVEMSVQWHKNVLHLLYRGASGLDTDRSTVAPETKLLLDLAEAMITATHGCRLSCNRLILVLLHRSMGVSFLAPHPRENHRVVEAEAWFLVEASA